MTTTAKPLGLKILAAAGLMLLLGSSLSTEARCGYDPYTLQPNCSNMWNKEDYIERTNRPPSEVLVSIPRPHKVNYEDYKFLMNQLVNRGSYQIPNVWPAYISVAAPAQTVKQRCEAGGGMYVPNSTAASGNLTLTLALALTEKLNSGMCVPRPSPKTCALAGVGGTSYASAKFERCKGSGGAIAACAVIGTYLTMMCTESSDGAYYR